MNKYFMLRLNPPRPTFAQDMTDAERKVMKQHVGYWTNLMNQGKALVFGPVLDPKGVYGLGIIAAESDEELKGIMTNDPANGLNKYECYPMNTIVPNKIAGL